MRTTLPIGLGLTVASVVAVLLSSVFDLQIETVVLLGVAGGAVLALVPDTSPAARVAGGVVGVLAALVGYVLRAAVLPDSAGGRAVAVAVVVLLVTAVAVLSAGRLALWAPLLGAALFAGAFERVYVAAPAETATTAVDTLTSLLLALAAGFLAASWAAPRAARADHTAGTGAAGTVAPEEPVSPATEESVPAQRSSVSIFAGRDADTDPNTDTRSTDTTLEDAR